jgi:hypothetical protein
LDTSASGKAEVASDSLINYADYGGIETRVKAPGQKKWPAWIGQAIVLDGNQL